MVKFCGLKVKLNTSGTRDLGWVGVNVGSKIIFRADNDSEWGPSNISHDWHNPFTLLCSLERSFILPISSYSKRSGFLSEFCFMNSTD